MHEVNWKRRENASTPVCSFSIQVSFSLFPTRGGSGILQLSSAAKHQSYLPCFSLKAVDLTQRRIPAKQKKMLVGDLVLLHSSNT